MNVMPKQLGNPGTPGSGRFHRFIVPTVLGCFVLLAELGGEPVRLWLRYQRDAVAAGELWRLMTGHLVHLGPSHTAMNIAALGVLTILFAHLMRPSDWLGIFVLSALSIDGGLFFVSTTITWYVGLSGVLHGFWAAACIWAWQQERRQAAALSALIVIKLAYEAWFGPVPLTGEVAAGPVVVAAHAYGAAGGVLWATATLAIRPLRRSI